MTPSVRASAPGKLFLTGEWAVLRNAPALVAAIDRRAVVDVALREGTGAVVVHSVAERSSIHLGPEAQLGGDAAAVAAVLQFLRPQGGIEGEIIVDSCAFLAEEGKKLGLGRSAATLAAVSVAVLAAFGERARERVLTTALAANQLLQDGLGSGADVVAAIDGGIVEVRRWGEQLGVTARTLPAGVEVVAAWTGTSAPTAALLRRFEARMQHRSEEAHHAMRELKMAAEDAATAAARDDAPGFLHAADRAGRWIDELGLALDLPLVTPALRRLTELARRPDVAAKPSGAGGGDCGIAFVRSPALAGAVRTAWRDAGFPPLDVSIDGKGATLG